MERATAADVSALAEVWHAGWHEGHAAAAPPELVAARVPAEFEERLGRWWPNTFVMRCPEGDVAGFFILNEDELYQFYVASRFHGQGVAKEMMAAAEAVLAPRRAWLACALDNRRAARFYEKCGWVQTRVEEYATESAQGPVTLDIGRFEKDLSGS